MSDAEKAVKAWCEGKVGNGYIYGAKGQTCSESFRRQQADQYPEWEDTIMNVGAKWDGMPVWDCAQFTRYAAKQGGVTLVSGATSQWNKTDWKEKGEIASLPEGSVAFLYRQENGKMQHTGVYQGDGTFIDARGTKYGVLHSKIGSYSWTHYAIPAWGAAEKEASSMTKLYDAAVKAEKGSTVNMRKTPSTDGAVVEKVPIGDTVEVYEDADGWAHIAHGGNQGYMMDKFLEKAEGGETDAGNRDSDTGGVADTDSGDYGAVLQELEAVKQRLTQLEALIDELSGGMDIVDDEEAHG